MTDGAYTEETTTFRWFGTSWGAPANVPRLRVSVPTATACVGCLATIAPDDSGVCIPHVRTRAGFGRPYSYWHRDCFLRDFGVDPGVLK